MLPDILSYLCVFTDIYYIHKGEPLIPRCWCKQAAYANWHWVPTLWAHTETPRPSQASGVWRMTMQAGGKRKTTLWAQTNTVARRKRLVGLHRRQVQTNTANRGAVHQHSGQNQWPSSWGSTQTQLQTQGISEYAAVAAGSNSFAWGKLATTLTLLTQFKSKKRF